jgi:hypothetical protein
VNRFFLKWVLPLVTHFLIIFCLFLLFPSQSFAAGDACVGIVVPDELPILTGGYLTFTVTNTGASRISGMRIMTSSKKNMPALGSTSDVFKIIERTNDDAVFTQGILAPGQKTKARIYTQTAFDERESVPWTIEATVGGADGKKITCTGYTQVRIKGLPLDGNPPQIGLDGIELLSSTSAQISWVTDKLATSGIAYWPQEQPDGQETEDKEEYIYNHQVVLTDLVPEIVYEYRLKATDQVGNEGESEVGTFETIAGTKITPTDTPREPILSTAKASQEIREHPRSNNRFDWYIILFWLWTVFKILYLSNPFWIVILLIIGIFL